MLKDKRLAQIHDFPETSDCFPGLNIRGGVCYFLWDREYKGDCTITNYKNGTILSISKRPLLEPKSDVFVRYNQAIDILRKVKKFNEKTFDEIVSSRKPFGLDSNFQDFKKSKTDKHNILLYRFGDNGYVREEQVLKNKNWVKEIKVLISKASPGGDSYPHQIISKPIVADKMSCCTETYLVVGIYKNKKIAENVAKYMHTRFFRFMMSLIKNTQNISRGVFAFVPIQDFSEPWTDEKLYKKYGLTKEEIAFIESMIRPMGNGEDV
jgi:site-specific DNA-methyltransferase (adenine-specific)